MSVLDTLKRSNATVHDAGLSSSVWNGTSVACGACMGLDH